MRASSAARISVCVVLALSMPQSAPAGSYLGTTICDFVTGCNAAKPASVPEEDPYIVNPQSIVHPVTFQQAGGTLTVRLCVESTVQGLLDAVDWAVARWNAMTPRTENCLRCTTFEEGDPDLGDPNARLALTTTVLHELGHCALALDHPNRIWDPEGDGSYDFTSFTLSWNATYPGGIDAGADFIRGSRDDTHDGPLGGIAESVSWFRRADNDPVVVDSTVIDTTTYSRSATSGLPPGSSWGANANRRVAETLGHGSTSAVMQAGQAVWQYFNDLAADDANMMKMARAGVDLMAGTSDDYTLSLEVVPCAESYDVRLRFLAMGVGGALGECTWDVDYAYPQNPTLARVFKLLPAENETHLELTFNSDIPWTFGVPLFVDGFDSGNTTAWSLTSP